MRKACLLLIIGFLTQKVAAQTNNLTIICPENTFLGVYDCTNITEIPEQPRSIEEAMAPPYNIQFDGNLSSGIRVDTEDDGIVFYCEFDPRMVNRSLILFEDVNFNFARDIGEEIYSCNYTIETIPDVTPLEITIPPDVELTCGLDPFDRKNTGFAQYEDNCSFTITRDPTMYEDEVLVNGNITTILRTWSGTDPCGNITSPQVQTITVNCTPECTPPNVGLFECEE